MGGVKEPPIRERISSNPMDPSGEEIVTVLFERDIWEIRYWMTALNMQSISRYVSFSNLVAPRTFSEGEGVGSEGGVGSPTRSLTFRGLPNPGSVRKNLVGVQIWQTDGEREMLDKVRDRRLWGNSPTNNQVKVAPFPPTISVTNGV